MSTRYAAAHDGVRIELLVDSGSFCRRLNQDLAAARGHVFAQALRQRALPPVGVRGS